MQYKYRIWCNTESDWVTEWGESKPTVCPNDDGHSIDTNSITIIDADDIFGYESHYEQEESESSTTSTSWQEKMDINVTDIPAGTYRVGWSFEWAYTDYEAPGAHFGIHVNWGSVTLMEVEKVMPKNAVYGDGCYDIIGGSGQFELSAGDHKIALNFCSGAVTQTAYIRRARLEFWRVK